jgi:hypothetical protein
MLAKKPDGMAVDAETGRLRWQPQAYQVGDHEVVLRVSDLRGGSDTQTFTITVRATNQGPAITSDPVVEAVQSALYVYPIRAVDPEGDEVTFVVTATDPQRTKHAVPAFDPNHPDVLSIDDQGVIRWKPTAGDLGDWTMDIVARDELGQGTRQVYRLAVVAPQAAADKPPVIVSSPATVAAVNSIDDGTSRQFVYTYLAEATDADSDPSGIRYALTENPLGMTIDEVTGQIQWQPTLAQLDAGEQPKYHYVTVEATSNGLQATQRYRIYLRRDNSAPEFVADWPTQIVAGQTYRHDLHVDDADGDRLEFTLNDAPPALAMDRYGRLTWTTTTADITKTGEAGQRVEVTVVDSFGALDQETFFVKVVADTSAPDVHLQLSPGTRVEESQELIIRVTAVDNVGVETITVDLVGTAANSTITQRLAVNADGIARYTPATVEPFTVVATAIDAAGNKATASQFILVTEPDTSAPVASITAPADRQVITVPTDIMGTVSDNQLTHWRLEATSLDGTVSRTIASQTYDGVTFLPAVGDPTPATLGQFDPTILPNGPYLIRLTAEDLGGNVATDEKMVEVEGKLKLGNFTLSFVDLEVPVAGLPITITRTYDTLEADREGDFGYGWRMDVANTTVDIDYGNAPEFGLDQYRPFVNGSRVVVTLPDGTKQGFTFYAKPNQKLSSIVFDYLPTFIPDAGVKRTLTVPSVGAIVGVGAFTVARFGFGYSTGESIAIGVLFGLSSFYLAAAMPLAAAVGGVLGEVIGFWFAIRGALLLAASVIELIANRASAYYNPAKAATLNNQWLTAFEAKYAAHPDPPKVALARSALSHLLTTASNTETRYDGIMTVLSMFGAAKPQSPCLAWAESVWKRQREYLQAHDAERLALQDLGIDITMIQWKSHVAAAHYTVEISLSPAAGAERWEIDNGWAFTEIDDLDAYAIGVPFARSGWDPDSKKFIMHEPPGRPGEILLP